MGNKLSFHNDIEKLKAEIMSKQNELYYLTERYQELTGNVEVFEDANEE